jgi:hypothetical protein
MILSHSEEGGSFSMAEWQMRPSEAGYFVGGVRPVNSPALSVFGYQKNVGRPDFATNC